ncbi:granzyme M [Nilaparvata lugens]|uniref:granzyme M n=1 Tax=Nilaparvata lugens TaxID=108931 RepID=UPI00193E61A5|nr:granzyme M [Nilaparvata lugens]
MMKVAVVFSIIAAACHHYVFAATELSEELGSGEIDGVAWNGLEENEILEDSQTRLSGGRNATITKFPFMASILVNNSLTGGGAILNRRWLVTGAYAASFADEASDILVRVGSASSFRGGFTSRAKRIVKHPQASGYRHDFALIQLETSLPPFSRHIRPIKIGDRTPRNGARVLFAAFGNDHPHHHPHQESNHDHHHEPGFGVLKETHFKFLESKKCKNHYFTILSFTKFSFCTEASNTTAPESKDFGSPLIYGKKAIGVFSGQWHDKPAVFVDLTKEKSFILKTIKK